VRSVVTEAAEAVAATVAPVNPSYTRDVSRRRTQTPGTRRRGRGRGGLGRLLGRPDCRPVLAGDVRVEIETLRESLADPDAGRFAAAVTALLGGVPVPATAPAVRAAVEQLRRAAFPPRSSTASHRPPFG